MSRVQHAFCQRCRSRVEMVAAVEHLDRELGARIDHYRAGERDCEIVARDAEGASAEVQLRELAGSRRW